MTKNRTDDADHFIYDGNGAQEDEDDDPPGQFDATDPTELPTAGCSCEQQLDNGVAVALLGLLVLPLLRRRPPSRVRPRPGPTPEPSHSEVTSRPARAPARPSPRRAP